MKHEIRKFFTPEAISRSLQRLPELKTKVLDFLFPESARINHPCPTISYDDLGLPSGNIPVIRRGSSSINLRPIDGTLKLIEPQPVSANTVLDAATVNTLSQMTGDGIQQMVDNRINLLRNALRMTAEALCAQVISGKISYPMRSDGGAMLSYEVDYGKPTVVQVSKKWNASETKITDIIKSLGEIKSAMAKNGYGIDVVFLVGWDVYSALIDKAAAVAHPTIIQSSTEGIQIGNLTIKLFEANYTDLKTGTLASGIPEKTIVAFDMYAGHKLFYASIDDLDANFAGLPFFVKQIKVDDPSGYRIIATNKPLPVINSKGIVTAQVLS